jgi:hypothetical protein
MDASEFVLCDCENWVRVSVGTAILMSFAVTCVSAAEIRGS